jgi:hypothetical protein
MVNGKKVDMSLEEEAKIEAEWEVNRRKDKEKCKQLEKEKLLKDSLRQSAEEKLESLGLSIQEIKAIF